ncbi:calcium channel YVC1 [Achaetomium macrosporum]|uniref:Calcium channel YVC1 n=1 Tax=Achaetomium macrosporum TaxID=79813 RepID=A0AAN7C5E8_9PEZI|nr:calcium channel YVC1 [Achaetomium macrosporum]
MGVDCPKPSPRSSCDDDDDEEDLEAALNPCGDEGGNMAPLLRLRQLPQGGHDDGGSVFHSVEGNAMTVMSVYVMMHRVRRLVMAAIDDAYTLDELRAPHMDHQVVRPLVDRLHNPKDPAIVYCLVANRIQFLRPRSDEALHQSINESRAILCELLATRVLRRFHEDHPGRAGLLLLANILVSGFDPCDTAPESVRSRRPQWPVQDRGGHERKLTALELAIVSESKMLIKSPACQLVVNAVYKGVVVYTPRSILDFIPDHYKYHPVSLYEPCRAAILNHRRLIVPQLRNIIELMHFAILLVLYMLTVAHYGFGGDLSGLRMYETAFNVFAAGWVLEQFAAVVEHGWEVHAQNLWSFLDVTFVVIYAAYGLVRAVELLITDNGYYALPVLCTAVPVLLTRIAFTLMPDNIVFIALHAMMRDFTQLTFIAIWCFAGFVMGLLFLARTSGEGSLTGGITWATITKWLLWIWFGLDGTGIERAPDFHPILGPTLIITFAFLGNTLFLTILVAILTNTFFKIIANEAAEIQFRRAVLTFQGVKSDAIFSYPPPFNIAALLVLLPLKFLVGPLAFHHINVAAIRVINAPVLLLISLWERRHVWARRSRASALRSWRLFPGLSPHGDIHAVFGSEPPPEVMDALEKMDALHDVVGGDRERAVGSPKELRGPASSVRRRRTSGSSSLRDSDGEWA